MKSLGFLVLWGIALAQSANALFFCLRTNPCWGALGVVGGLLDCLGNLVVTVTPPAVTQTKTVTAVVSAVDTVTVTTSTTATVATTTVLFTESTTTTASTATNTVLQTTTFLTTSTNVVTAPGITTTTTVYGVPPAKMMARDTDVDVVARGNNPWGIPDYAWPACQDWDHYVDACKCFGIHPITVTKKPTTTTVTVTASNAITTTVSTLTTTTTNTVPATATTSATFTAVIEVIASTTITQTVTQASTIVVSTTTNPTVTSTTLCKATDVPFRVFEGPGSPRFLGVVFGVFVVWAADGDPPPVPSIEESTFVLDENGFIELATPPGPGAPDTVFIIDLSVGGSTPSQRLFGQGQDVVESTPEVLRRIKGCIDPVTNILSLSVDGRSNLFDCEDSVYLSSGDGSDIGLSCVPVTAIAV